MVSLIFIVLKLFFLNVFLLLNSSRHTVTQPNMAMPATHTSSSLTIKLSPLTPTPIPLQNKVSYSFKYQQLTNSFYLGW